MRRARPDSRGSRRRPFRHADRRHSDTGVGPRFPTRGGPASGRLGRGARLSRAPRRGLRPRHGPGGWPDDPGAALRARDRDLGGQPRPAGRDPADEPASRRPSRAIGGGGGAARGSWPGHRRHGLLDPLDGGGGDPDLPAPPAPPRRQRCTGSAARARRDGASGPPLAQPRWHPARDRVVSPAARHALRGHLSPGAVSPLRRARQQPRLVHVHPGRDAADGRASAPPLASADHARRSPDGPGGGAALRPPLHRPMGAERRPRPPGRGERDRDARRRTPHLRRATRGRHERDLRRLDTGAGLSAHPWRRADPFGDGLGPAGDAGAGRGPRAPRADAADTIRAHLRGTSPLPGPGARGASGTSSSTSSRPRWRCSTTRPGTGRSGCGPCSA